MSDFDRFIPTGLDDLVRLKLKIFFLGLSGSLLVLDLERGNGELIAAASDFLMDGGVDGLSSFSTSSRIVDLLSPFWEPLLLDVDGERLIFASFSLSCKIIVMITTVRSC